MDESLTKAVCHKKDMNGLSFLILQQVAHLVDERKSRAKRETHPFHQSLNDNRLPTFSLLQNSRFCNYDKSITCRLCT